MRKSYSGFTVADIKVLGISMSHRQLFVDIQANMPSDFLIQVLASYHGLPLLSEKAKSECLIAPVLNEVRLKNPTKMTFFSGCQFNVDEKRGLKGFCDFLVSAKYDAVFVESPLLAIVEAKNNQDLLDASPQCIAEMYAAQLFNAQEKTPNIVIFGAVTNGHEWLFLQLEGTQVIVDTERYYLNDLPHLLAVWQTIVDSF
jgi:hypothetical protein